MTMNDEPRNTMEAIQDHETKGLNPMGQRTAIRTDVQGHVVTKATGTASVGALYTQTVTTTPSGIGVTRIPTGATSARGYINGSNVVRFTWDGTTAPTASRGEEANPDDTIVLESRDEMEKFSAYSVTATIDWQFARDVSE